jgi:hypothetical protein
LRADTASGDEALPRVADRMTVRIVIAAAAIAAVAATSSWGSPLPTAKSCPVFPADNAWNQRVDALPVAAGSAETVAAIGPTKTMHADFGSGLWDGGPIGIPYVTVPGTQQRVPISFQYAGESDPGPYPIPANAPIEGGSQSTGDRHVLVVDRDRCRLWETFATYPNGDGTWRAGSGATWNLSSNALRPASWTSADAAGLPILPGLVRYDELAAGSIDHAIRITLNRTDNRYVWPARHRAGAGDSTNAPMGARLRLKASFDIRAYPQAAQVVLRALKKYGAIVADNGSSWYISGVPDPGFDNDALHTLQNVHGSDFEFVDASSLMIDPDSGQARPAP